MASRSCFVLSLFACCFLPACIFKISNDEGAVDLAGAAEDGGGEDTTIPPTSAAAARVIGQLGIYNMGGTIDDNGDGVPDVTITVRLDGSRSISVAGANAHERQHTEWTSATDYTVEGDQDSDGVIDETITSKKSGTKVTIVWERDLDLDGVFDWRSTTVIDVGTPTLRPRQQSVEELGTPAGGGPRAYAVTSMYETGAGDNACAHAPDTQTKTPDCWYEGLPETLAAVFPVSLTLPSLPQNFRFLTSGAMACNTVQIARLARAIDRGLGDIDEIGGVNTGYRDLMRQVLGEATLVYGCKLPGCSPTDVVASSYHPGNLPFGPNDLGAITALDPTILAEDIDGIEEIIIHEWLHLTGKGHPVTPAGELARDFIYACSRVGNHCRAYPKNYLGNVDDASSARDAAMCADLANKRRFGSQPLFLDSDIGFIETSASTEAVPPLCTTNPMVPPTGNCECHLMLEQTYCDQTVVSAPERAATMKYDTFACCETCPAATPVNDGTCGSSGAKKAVHFAAPACDPVGSCKY